MTKGFPGLDALDDDELDTLGSQPWNWGRISRDEAVKELSGKPEGTFLVRMSQSQDDAYSISVVQDGQVRHIRVLSVEGGFCINKADAPCETIADLIAEKQGEKIKSKLQGETTKETVLLRHPHPFPEDDAVVFDGKSFLSK
ncbi:hypothetical protein PTSG_00866 [Salpingoeca rosetta]|uniref:SH2 domain-containing protein n=1 Tax=Salpingoeca rosetta (strain ATCC 50818 / BSB-021) TaxID=946362 RepID=F2TXQ0_SALR5|nr:uncharacterized protein PTSG_00866 [Salpingoeca rosetta]EGD76159.1 hypothetical protein PTSG_00866 [Salpingoeca rosetta]|eukprot:XP_004998334.1 hypothetical protein PTSG_00866 [Salpingoeca rosetta]